MENTRYSTLILKKPFQKPNKDNFGGLILKGVQWIRKQRFLHYSNIVKLKVRKAVTPTRSFLTMTNLARSWACGSTRVRKASLQRWAQLAACFFYFSSWCTQATSWAYLKAGSRSQYCKLWIKIISMKVSLLGHSKASILALVSLISTIRIHTLSKLIGDMVL